jgi:lysophospholipase L1-like esterase
MTDQVRQRLSLWGGYGGPGFLQLGLAQYRHAGAKLETTGKWRHQPILPAQRTRVLDGVFGYGGQRTIPTEGASVRVELKPGRLAPEEAMRWTLVVRLGPGDRLEAAVGSSRRVIEHETDGGEPLRELSFDAPAREAFSLRHLAGAPEIFGVFVDRVRPGVVLDNAGINGARVATPLAWEPAQYQFEVSRRRPDLLALAYGTNEAFDNTNPERYAEHYRELVGRVRAAVPDISCWIIGAPDAATSDGRSITRLGPILAVQRSVARELGCAFTSAQAVMGGERSFENWLRASPPLARGDRIHLTILGYETLGKGLGLSLLPETTSSVTLGGR